MENGYHAVTGKNGVKVFYIKKIPSHPKAIVIISHGYRGHSGQYYDFINFLADHNYGAYAYDNRGHGRSQEEKGHLERYEHFIEDTDTIIRKVKKDYPNLPLFMFGHSMGGFIAFVYGILYPQNLRGQVFSAPAVGMPWGAEYIPSFMYKMLKFFSRVKIYPVLTRQACRDLQYKENLNNDPYVLKYSTCGFFYEFVYRGIKWAERHAGQYNLPCLFLHGTGDRIIPYRHSVRISKKISSTDKTLKLYDGLYHELLQEPEKEQIMNDIIIWLEQKT